MTDVEQVNSPGYGEKLGTKALAFCRKYLQTDFFTFTIILTAGTIGGLLSSEAFEIVGLAHQGDGDSLKKMGLGIAAAGIGTLVVANSNRKDRLHLFFLALLFAITYPRVLGDVLSEEEKQLTSATRTSDLVVQARTISRLPAEEIRPDVLDVVESNIGSSIDVIAKQATSQNHPSEKTVADLTELVRVAREKGYNGIAVKGAEALTEIGPKNSVQEAFGDRPTENILNTVKE